MKKILEIDACEDCKNFEFFDDLHGCLLTDKPIIDFESIPDWCPLPDAKSGQEDNEK